MYIGPWQEYRLAKIQDDAIQRIREEWEANIRAQVPDGDDHRVHDLMQPLMAKLPSLLLGAKSSDSRNNDSRRAKRPSPASSRQPSRPSTAVSIASSSHSRAPRSDTASRSESRKANSNQETHETENHAVASVRRPPLKKKTKGGGKALPLTSLSEVQKRKKMFATWMKATKTENGATEQPAVSNEAVRLPPIHQEPSTSAVAATHHIVSHAAPTRLPPLVDHHDVPQQPEVDASAEEGGPNLDDSLDEDEVSQLLNWTDNLLSPSGLEASLGALDDLDDIG